MMHFIVKCCVKTRHTEQKTLKRESYGHLSSHLPSSVTDVWYPCGRVSFKSTVGLSMFSLASMPDVPPPSGTVFLKMWRGAGCGACGGGGARAFILLLDDGKDIQKGILIVVCCSFLHPTRFSIYKYSVLKQMNNRHSFQLLYLSITFTIHASVKYAMHHFFSNMHFPSDALCSHSDSLLLILI